MTTQTVSSPPGDVAADQACRPADRVDVAVAAARAAAPAWRARPDRADVLRRAADVLRDRVEELGDRLVAESGSTPVKAMFEVFGAADELDAAADAVALLEPSVVPTADPSRTATVQRVALGVVGVISPWNFPLLLGTRSVAPALAAGNAVVLKADPKTPVSGGVVLRDALVAAGLAPDVLGLVDGDAVEGEALVRHPGVDGVAFTGSTEVGRHLGAVCGGLLKPISLELGGNNAFVVLGDADPEGAASAGAWGGFLHQGQICMAARRHFVHASIHDEYVARLRAHAAALVVGVPGVDECHLGPVITDEAATRIATEVAAVSARGADTGVGARTTRGRLVPPTVVSGVALDDPLLAQETFGPVVVVVPFASDDEVVTLVNAVEHGLVAGVYTPDTARGEALGARLEVGTVHVGDQSVNHDPRVPFAGAKASGNGHGYGGPAGVESFTRWRTVVSGPPRTYPF